MWTKSLLGTKAKRPGLKWPLVYLLVSFSFCPSLLCAQTAPDQSETLSKMTREQLIEQIKSKDKLLQEWLEWQAKEKISQAELGKAYQRQIETRDQKIKDQGYEIEALKGDRLKDSLFWGAIGAGAGILATTFLVTR